MSKPTRKNPTHGRKTEPDPLADDPIERLVRIAVVALWLVRWLIPTESAAAGDTLWIAQSWFLLGLLWAWGRIRRGDFAIRVDLFDAGLWIIVAGHAIATAGVFAHGGDRRAAIDMCWEWTSIGVSFFLTRQVFFARADGRRLATAIAALAVVLAGLGISQPFVFYRQALNEYRTLIDEYDRLSANPGANADRLADVTLKLDAQGIPTDAVGRRQYENRLRNSNEPFGPFALANSFAGLLVGSIFIARGLFRSTDRPLSRGAIAAWAISFLLLAYCLVLTKSRTAWAGVLCGFAVAALLECWTKASGGRKSPVSGVSISESDRPPRFKFFAITIAIALALIALAVATSGLDRLVFTEVSKSFGYRIQYWTGAAQIIREHPLLGIAPGNFRSHYLRHKAPEASEEIADPHQLLLDLWTSGGLLAVAGPLVCLVAAILVVRREFRVDPETSQTGSYDASVRIGGLIAFVLASASGVLAGTGGFDPQQLGLMLCWWIAFEIVSRQPGSALPVTQLIAAGIALLVHLSGAGGIEMPALVQLLWTIVALASARGASSEAAAVDRPAWPAIAAGGVALLAFIGCLYSATIPVLHRRAAISAGDQAMIVDRNFESASQLYQAAAAADPFSNEPLQKLADIHFAKAQSVPLGGERDYDKAAGFLKFAAQRNPFDWSPHRRLGDMAMARFTRTREAMPAREAADHFAAALARYPNNSALRASRASALASAGETASAREEAKRAIQLDEINHQRGHSDRYLSETRLAEMRRLASP